MLVQPCINNVTFMTMLTQPCDKIVTLQQHSIKLVLTLYIL